MIIRKNKIRLQKYAERRADPGNFKSRRCQNWGRKRSAEKCIRCLCQSGNTNLQFTFEYAESFSGWRYYLLHWTGNYKFLPESWHGYTDRRKVDESHSGVNQCNSYRMEHLSDYCKIGGAGALVPIQALQMVWLLLLLSLKKKVRYSESEVRFFHWRTCYFIWYFYELAVRTGVLDLENHAIISFLFYTGFSPKNILSC